MERILTSLAMLTLTSCLIPFTGSQDGGTDAVCIPTDAFLADARLCQSPCVDLAIDPANCGVMGNACGGGRTCFSRSCAVLTPGAACVRDCDCGGSGWCVGPSSDFPGGSCTYSCNSDSDCGPNGACTTGGGVCLMKCSGPFDCRGEYTCAALPGYVTAVCVPRCTNVPMPVVCR